MDVILLAAVGHLTPIVERLGDTFVTRHSAGRTRRSGWPTAMALLGPEFRVYFQDSGTHVGVGFGPAPGDADYRKVDVALICGSGDFKGLNHPAGIVTHLQPRHVIVGHWEDFFVTQRAICSEKEVRGLPREDPARIVEEARDAQKAANLKPSVYLPCPTASRFQVAIDPRADQSRAKKETVLYDCTKIR